MIRCFWGNVLCWSVLWCMLVTQEMFVCPVRRWISPYLSNIEPPDSTDRIRPRPWCWLTPHSVHVRLLSVTLQPWHSPAVISSLLWKNHNLKEPNCTFIAFQGSVKCSYATQIKLVICGKTTIKFVIYTLWFHFKIITLWCTFYDFVVERDSTENDRPHHRRGESFS